MTGVASPLTGHPSDRAAPDTADHRAWHRCFELIFNWKKWREFFFCVSLQCLVELVGDGCGRENFMIFGVEIYCSKIFILTEDMQVIDEDASGLKALVRLLNDDGEPRMLTVVLKNEIQLTRAILEYHKHPQLTV
jgi:hypothetical protein